MERRTLHSRDSAFENIHETLSKAQHEHWLDCPNASVGLRLASLTLDIIFVYLVTQGLHKIFQALSFYSPTLNAHAPGIFDQVLLGFMDIFLRVSFLFVYFTISVCELGGTVGKLLLGLRVVDSETGKELNLSRVILRLSIALLTNFLSVATAMARKDHLPLHDVLCKSAVKKVRGRK